MIQFQDCGLSKEFFMLKSSIPSLLIPLILFISGCGEKPVPPEISRTPAEATEPSVPAVQPENPGWSENQLVAEYKGGALRIREIQDFVEYNQILGLEKLRPENVLNLDHEKLRQVALWPAISDLALKDLEGQNDPDLLKYCEELYPQNKERAFMLYLVNTHIYDHLQEFSEERIREYYEKHKVKYKQPFQFHMRHLILLTYQPYVVTESDIEDDSFSDMEKIAERLSGDKTLASNIRMDVPGRPLRHDEEKQWKSLNPGEKLLIPMNEEQAAAVKKRLDDIVGEVSAEKTFEEMCIRYSDSDSKGDIIGPLPTGTRPMLGTLLDIARKTPVGELSEIFRTKHGYQVIEVTERKDEGFKPIENVRNSITTQLKTDDNQRLLDELLHMLFEDPALKIDYDVIARGDALSTDTVIARLGGEKLLWNDFSGVWIQGGSPMDQEGILKRLKMIRPLQLMLIRKFGNDQLQDPDSELSRVMPGIRAFSLGSRYIGRNVAEQTFDYITPDLQREFYEENKEKMFKTQPRVAYRSIVAMLSPEDRKLDSEGRTLALETLKKKLEKDMAGIRTAEEFLKMEPILNAPYVARGHKVPMEEEPVVETRIYKDYRDQLNLLEPGGISPVFIVQNRGVASILLLESIPSRIRAIEDEGVLDAINQQILKRQSRIFQEALIEEYAARAEFRFIPGAGN
jgi:hypothetical protein